MFSCQGRFLRSLPQTRDQVLNKSPRCWNIKYVQRVLGRAVCNNLSFAHAILICDTTSRVFSIGIGLALQHIRSDNHFITRAEIFLQENATLADISSAGEAALVYMYTGAVGDTLDKLRLQRFHQKVATSTCFVQPLQCRQLPSTIASVFTSRCKYGRGNRVLVHICIHRILAGKQ